MIDYSVCAQDSLPSLVEDVNELLSTGYELVGNLLVVQYELNEEKILMFYQPMIKRVGKCVAV